MNKSDEQLVATREPRNSYPKTVWITTTNIGEDDRFKVKLELDGKEEILESTWIPCLNREEGIHSYGHNLTNILIGRDKLIEKLEQKNAILIEALENFEKSMDREGERHWAKCTRDLLEKIKEMR